MVMQNFHSFLSGKLTPMNNTLTHVVDDVPGLYAIFIKEVPNDNSYLARKLKINGTRLLYIGKAEISLHKRLFKQDLRHINPSTFFRGLGNVLGYMPEIDSMKHRKKSNNYFFSNDNTLAICKWIDENLLFEYIPVKDLKDIKIEKELIKLYQPILNSVHNPNRCKELASLRKRAREIALGR